MSGACRTMAECLVERLDVLRRYLGGDVQIWYDDGASLDEFSGARSTVGDAWSYLQGAADQSGCTVMELLDGEGLTLSGPVVDDVVYRCACSWIGGDPDVRKSGKPPTCPACWKNDHKRVVVRPTTREPAHEIRALVPLTEAQLVILREAIDSHLYETANSNGWPVNSGFVLDPRLDCPAHDLGLDDREICAALDEHDAIEKLLIAHHDLITSIKEST